MMTVEQQARLLSTANTAVKSMTLGSPERAEAEALIRECFDALSLESRESFLKELTP